MIRRAGPQDEKRMEAFLAAHAETSMFLRGNLAAHGTEEKFHDHGTTFYLEEHECGVCAVGGVTNGGYVMSQSAPTASGFHAAFAAELAGRKLQGMTGAPVQVAAVFDALGCQNAAFSLREQEPLYALDVSDLNAAHFAEGHLRPPAREDAGWLEDWFDGFHSGSGLPVPVGQNLSKVVQSFLKKRDARILMMNGEPVAMSAFNARAKETVQIGGVYVPPSCRGAGYGGGVVARHLLEAKTMGITRAVLFAASDVAARAYERIGFRHIGSYELALFQNPWQVPA